MAELGQFALLLSLFLSGYAAMIDPLGSYKKQPNLNKSADNATKACFLCLTIAMACLLVLLVQGDFNIKYVVEFTSTDLPLPYKISALWAGAAGSLLLWLWLQVGFVVMVFRESQNRPKNFSAPARAIANLVSVFFLIVLLKDKNPFEFASSAHIDGSGLNPLLQHPAMVLHPPTLFIGYAAFLIPFAWTIASLKHDHFLGKTPLFAQARNWILLAWLFLTIGIVLGAWWAYEELGWGGYWAWDPVENSSLMPWLTATALLHCSRTYRERSSIATWMMILSLVTYSLCIFGTFLTRYGLVSSVHAFPDPGLGILFLVLIIHIWIIAGILLLKRHICRKDETKVTMAKGIRFIIYNNWLLVLLTFVIFVGTLFPFFSSLVTDNQISLKPEYFNKITTPGGLLFLLLLAMCPHLLRFSIRRDWRLVILCFAVIAAVAAWFLTKAFAIPCFIICAFALFNLISDVIDYEKSISKRKREHLSVKRNVRWYGARIVHIGVVLVFVGIAGSGGYDEDKYFALRPGDKITIGNFDIVYDGLRAEDGPNFIAIAADLLVYKEGELLSKLSPSKAYYDKSEKPVSEVDIRRTLAYDLYTALTEADADSKLINLRVLIKPLINWMWIGSILSTTGVLVVLVSLYKRKQIINQTGM